MKQFFMELFHLAGVEVSPVPNSTSSNSFPGKWYCDRKGISGPEACSSCTDPCSREKTAGTDRKVPQ